MKEYEAGYYCPICHRKFKGKKVDLHKAEHEQKSIKEEY
jgi:hypothetical protein